jgi:serine/threonine-protein kinase RsbW
MPQTDWNDDVAARRLLGRIAPVDLVGRVAELAAITRHGRRETQDRALLLVCEPGAGASELLRQSFDSAFHLHDEIVPVYFRLGESDRSTGTFGQRFLRTFLHQVIAFRQNDQGMLAASPSLRDLIELAAPGDASWVEDLVQAFERERGVGEDEALLHVCLSAPLRAARRGVLPFVLIDDLHHADLLTDGPMVISALYAALSRANIPFLLAGRRRRVVKLVETAREEIITGPSLKLDRFDAESAAELAQRRAARLGVALNEETRDLLAQQLDGNPKFINAALQAARDAAQRLDSYRGFQTLYVDQLMGGGLGRINSSRLDEVMIAAPQVSSSALIELLHEGLEGAGRAAADGWRRRLEVSAEELALIAQILCGSEFIDLDGAAIETSRNSAVRTDYLRLRNRVEVQQLPRALVVSDAVVDYLKRAPLTMAREYRRAAALGVRELLARFEGQAVPAGLFEYGTYRRTLKGRQPGRIRELLATSPAVRRLPLIIQSSYGGAVFPPLRAVCDDERCAVARGFDGSEYNDANEIAWLAAEVESKVEAGRGLVEIWCDRLDNVARGCGFKRWVVWLISPEGFSEEALGLLDERNALSSNLEQFQILRETLEIVIEAGAATETDEWEIPMSADAELAAAESIEEFARRHQFPPDAINQIKTSVIEACINASEHSLSPDRKIRLQARMEDDERLVILVASRGVQRAPDLQSISDPSLQNRGMGLGLIRNLMDEVEFERVDDGTRLRLVKVRAS